MCRGTRSYMSRFLDFFKFRAMTFLLQAWLHGSVSLSERNPFIWTMNFNKVVCRGSGWACGGRADFICARIEWLQFDTSKNSNWKFVACIQDWSLFVQIAISLLTDDTAVHSGAEMLVNFKLFKLICYE